MGPNTSAYCSCSATLNGELFVFGGTGSSQNKQVRCNNQTSADSTVRVLSLSRFCPDFQKIVSGVCLSGRTRTRQSCPDFRCPCPPTSGNNYNVSKPKSKFQISKVVDCTLKRIGELPNEFDRGACGNFLFDGDERVMFCFPLSNNRKCFR